MKNIIEITDLYLEYDEKKILNGVNLIINKGEFIGITGKNGSGKSTLARTISGLEEITKGKIVVDGIELNNNNSQHIRKILSMVFQNPNNQIIGTKVIDDLVFGLENYGVSRSEIQNKISKISKELGIEELLYRNPSELSGGQKQIVAIAGVLILDPKIIIFDEVTSMLDNASKKLVYNQILKLVKTHTIVMITHDSRELIETERVILLENGRIREDISPDELFKNSSMLKKYNLEKPFKYIVLEELEKRGYKEIGDIYAD